MDVIRIPLAVGVAMLAWGCAGTTRALDTNFGEPQVIGSHEELEAYLATNPSTPFDALSAPARARFHRSLTFRAGRLAGFGTHDLRRELSAEQGLQLLRLFGPEAETYASVIFPNGHVPLSEEERASEVEKRYSAMLDVRSTWDDSTSGRERAEQMSQAYLRLFPPADHGVLEALTERELRTRLEAASLVARGHLLGATIDEVLHLARALDGLHGLREEDAAIVQGLLIAARRFDDARALATRFPSLERIPAFAPLEVPGARTLWQVGQDRILTQKPAPSLNTVQVVITASPICAPTLRLAEATDADETLKALLESAIWLVPAFPNLLIDPIVEWEQRYPWAPLQLVHRETDWPEVEEWETPVLYFVKDGKVLETVTGWPIEGRMAALMAAAEKAGLTPGAPPAR